MAHSWQSFKVCAMDKVFVGSFSYGKEGKKTLQNDAGDEEKKLVHKSQPHLILPDPDASFLLGPTRECAAAACKANDAAHLNSLISLANKKVVVQAAAAAEAATSTRDTEDAG